MNTWRQQAQAAIAKALEDVTSTAPDELRRILFDAYPFGVRQYHPYKIWCDAVNKEIERRTGQMQRGKRSKEYDHPWMQAARKQREK